MLKSREMAYPAPTKGFLWVNTDTAMLFTPFGSTHLPLFYPFHSRRTYLPRTLQDMTSYALLGGKGLKMMPNFEIFFRMHICGTALA